MSKNIKELAERIEAAYKEINAIRNEIREAMADTQRRFTPDDNAWVDLGLSSGRLWYGVEVEGYFTHEEAVEVFGENLPSAVAMAELYEECEWEWDNEKKGYKVIGPNGNSIFLSANGYKDSDGDLNYKGSYGYYWTKCVSKTSQAYARYLGFHSGCIYPLNYHYRAYGFSVRPVRE